jgi:hypothetical protein
VEIIIAIVNIGLLAAFFSHTGIGRRVVAWFVDDRPIKGPVREPSGSSEDRPR